MTRVLITGGTGFVGRHLVSLLQNQGCRLGVLASRACAAGISSVECFDVDVRDAEQVELAIQQFRPDQIYHLAAISAVDFSWKSPRTTYEVNVFGTLNVLQAAANLASRPRVLNVSTAQVYARSPNPLNEKSPLGPASPYAASKAMTEMIIVQRHDDGGGTVTVRSFNHAGPGQTPNFVLSSIARQFAEIEAGLRDPKLSLGNISVRRDFTDVRDVVRAYSLLVEKGIPGEVYNVCSGRTYSISELISYCESISGIKANIETRPEKLRAIDADTIWGDCEKLHSTTGWEPQIPITTTIADTLDYWRAALREKPNAPAEGEDAPSLSPLQST